MRHVDIFKSGDPVTTALLQRITLAVAELQSLAIVAVKSPLQLAGQTLMVTPSSQGLGFWAEITGNDSDGDNKYTYSFYQVYKPVAGYGEWAELTNGLAQSSSENPARNTKEDMNAASGMMGCGVDADHLDTADWTFTLTPIPTGAIVWMRIVPVGSDIEFWFDADNGVDGECD